LIVIPMAVPEKERFLGKMDAAGMTVFSFAATCETPRHVSPLINFAESEEAIQHGRKGGECAKIFLRKIRACAGQRAGLAANLHNSVNGFAVQDGRAYNFLNHFARGASQGNSFKHIRMAGRAKIVGKFALAVPRSARS
jgi:hypothetical protein